MKEKMAFSRCNDKYKGEINKLLTRYGRRDKLSLVLDGAKAETSKTLIKHGFKGNSIYIPNPTKDFKFLIKKYRAGCDDNNCPHKFEKDPCVFKNWLYDLLPRFDKYSLGLAYFDYMCTIEGNEKCSPINDIQSLFDKKLLADGSCLAVTISVHDSRKKRTIFKHQDLLHLLSVVNSTSLKNGYTTEVIKGAGLYRRTMWTIIFKVYLQDPALFELHIK